MSPVWRGSLDTHFGIPNGQRKVSCCWSQHKWMYVRKKIACDSGGDSWGVRPEEPQNTQLSAILFRFLNRSILHTYPFLHLFVSLDKQRGTSTSDSTHTVTGNLFSHQKSTLMTYSHHAHPLWTNANSHVLYYVLSCLPLRQPMNLNRLATHHEGQKRRQC